MVKDDKYYFHQTPEELCKKLMLEIPIEKDDVLFEPFKGEGNFYRYFPEENLKYYTEIEEGLDFRSFDKEMDWVISNPPFKLENKINAFYQIVDYFSTKVRKGMALLGNDYCVSTFTPKRLKEINEKGIYIQKIIVCSVKKWRGRYFFIIFSRNPNENFKYIEGNY
jgi:hypothetical protein